MSVASPVRSLVTLVAGTPLRLLLVSWGIALALYFTGPVVYDVVPGASTWLFVFACTAAFALGSELGRTLRLRKRPETEVSPAEDVTRADRVALIGSIAGIVGIAAIAVDKVFFSGLDFSQGMTALRIERADEVMAGTHTGLHRTPLLYFGFVTFSFSIVSYLIYFLRPQALRVRTQILAHLGLVSPVVFSWLYGGRTPLWLLLALASGAALIRVISGRPMLPEGGGRIVIALFLAGNALYTMYVFQDRRQFIGMLYYDQLKALFEDAFPGHPSPVLDRLVAHKVVEPGRAMDVLFLNFYFTHEMPVLDMTMREGRAGPYWGQYQFYLVTALLARVAPSLSYDNRITSELRAAGVYGWFSSAWGGMYLDFGTAGATLGAFVCGWLSGVVYRSALRRKGLGAQLVLCYVMAGILVSPVLSMFTISISLPVLVSIVLCALALRTSAVSIPGRRLFRRVPAV